MKKNKNNNKIINYIAVVVLAFGFLSGIIASIEMGNLFMLSVIILASILLIILINPNIIRIVLNKIKTVSDDNKREFEEFISNNRICYTKIYINKLFVLAVSIDKQGNLFSFTTNQLPTFGYSNNSYFISKPQKIKSFTKLKFLVNMKYCIGLNKENWQDYFMFVFDDVKEDGTNLVKKLLIGDIHSILDAAHFIISTSVKSKEYRISLLKECYENYKLIKSNVNKRDHRGHFDYSDRFVEKALYIISELYNRECFCDVPFDRWSGTANSFADKGYLIVEPDKTEGGHTIGVIECPICHTKYRVDIGGHIATSSVTTIPSV